MKHFLRFSRLFLLTILFVFASSAIFATAYYSRTTGGNPALLANWTDAPSGTGGNSPATGAFTAAANTFNIISGVTMTTTGGWTVGGNGGAGSGTILKINSGGTLSSPFAVTIGTAGTFTVEAGGTYKHGNTGSYGSTIFGGTTTAMTSTSTFEFNCLPNTPAFPTSTQMPAYGNLVINLTTDPGSSVNFSGNLTSVLGSLTIQNTQNREIRLVGNTSPFSLSIAGNLNISGSTSLFSLCSGTSTPIITVSGDVNVSGGSLIFSSSSSNTVATLNVKGNLNHTGGTLTKTTGGSGTGVININGTTSQAIESTGQTSALTFNVAPTSAGTVQIAATKTFVVSSGSTFNVVNGSSAAELTVNGTLSRQTTVAMTTTGAAIIVGGSGIYTHGAGTDLLLATWTNPGSLCNVTSGSTSLTNVGQSFYNFTLNTSSNTNINNASFTVAGTLDLLTTNSATLKMNSVGGTYTQVINNITVSGGTISCITSTGSENITGNLTINTGGTFNATTSTGNLTITGNVLINGGVFNGPASTGTTTITGNVTLGGGTFNAVTNSGTTASTTSITGNLTINSGTFNVSTGSSASSSALHTLAVGGNVTINGGGINLNTIAGATANCVLNVAGDLNLAGGTLTRTQTATNSNSTGIYFSGTGTQNFSWSAGTITNITTKFYQKGSPTTQLLNETYSTSSVQTTICGTSTTTVSGYIGITTNNNLTINNSAGVTLSVSKTINGTLTLTSGVVTLGTNNLTVSSATGLSGGSSSAYINASSTGLFNRTIGSANTYLFPLGSATAYNPASFVWVGAPGITQIASNYFSSTALSQSGTPSTGCLVVNAALDNGYWKFTPTGTPSNFNLTLTRNGQTNDGDDIIKHAIVNRSGAGVVWTIPGVWTQPSSTAISPATSQISVTQTGLSTLGEFDIAQGNNPTTPSPTVTVNQFHCVGSTVDSLVATGTAIKWYAASAGGSNLPNTDVLTATNYYASQTIGTCESPVRAAVVNSLNALPTATASSSPVCIGSALTLTGGSSSLTSYTWTGPNSYISNSQSPTVSSSATSAMAGTYTIEVANAKGCRKTAATTVVVNTLPIATAASNSPVCVGSSLSLGGADAMSSYTWTGPNTYSSSTQNPTVSSSATSAMTGTYTVEIADANGCRKTASTIVTINTAPVISAPNVSVCPTDMPAELMATCSNCTVNWYDTPTKTNLLQGNSTTYIANQAGNYYVESVNTLTGCSTPGVLPAIVLSSTDITLPVISGLTNKTATTALDMCEVYDLDLGFPTVTDNCGVDEIYNDAPTIFLAGITHVTWTATDLSGNVKTFDQTVTVTDNNGPTFNPIDAITINAVENGVVLKAQLPEPVDFAFDACSGVTFTNNAPASMPVSATPYNITWTASDGSNTATQNQFVTIVDNIAPVLVVPNNVNVTSDNGSCNATGVSLGAPTISDNSSGTVVTNNAPTTFPTGTTQVLWTATDVYGNTSSATQLVVVSPSAPVATPGIIDGNPAICGGSTFDYTIAPVTNATSYSWTFPAGTVVSYYADGGRKAVVSFASASSTGNLSVKAYSACSFSAPRELVLYRTPPSTPGTISCSEPTVGLCATSATFSITSVARATYYIWSVPTGVTISSGQGTTSINVTINPLTFKTGSVTVSAASTCGVSANRTLAIARIPAIPGVISGPAKNVCDTSVTYSVTPEASATTYTWTVPTGAVIRSGQGTNSIVTSLTNSFVAGNVTVQSVNACATSSARVLAISRTSAKPSSISAPTSLCDYDTLTEINVCTAPIVGVTYNWTMPAGLRIISGQGLNCVRIKKSANFVSGTISVTTNNGCNTSAATSLTIKNYTEMPGAIVGSTTGLCGGQTGVLYSLSYYLTSYNYGWVLPSGVTLSATQPQNNYRGESILVDVAPTFVSGTIKAHGINGCGMSTDRTLAISSAPVVPGAISGEVINVCSNQVYSISPVIGATNYTWTIPAGATIASGQGSASITMSPGTFTSGNVSVKAGSTGCATSAAKTLAIAKGPSVPRTAITGEIANLCLATGKTYSMAWVVGANSYNWTVPSGSTITAGQGSNTITVTFGDVLSSSQVAVAAVGTCVTTAYKTLALNDCNLAARITNANFNEQHLGIANLYPNPSNGSFTVDVESGVESEISIQLFDATGKLVSVKSQQVISGINSINTNIESEGKGLYLIRITDINTNQSETKTVIVE